MQDNRFILVPLDGSKNAENALPAAARLARAFGLGVKFIHVVSPSEGPWGPEDVEHASELFAPYARGLAGRHGLEVQGDDVMVAWGQAAPAILEAAADAALIVIASHGRGGFRAAFIGSVADKVVRGAPVPVLVIPGTGSPQDIDGDQPVLVAVDGSEASERALCMARAVAQRLGANITLMQAYRLAPVVAAEFVYYPADYAPSLQRAAEDSLRSLAGPGEQVLVVDGNPASAIVAIAQDINAGLVVMASSGKGLAARITLGSTTDRVMHSIRRPLLIVPAGSEADALTGERAARP